jgi:hypothetical protein
MKLSKRDQRALAILVVALALLAIRFVVGNSGPEIAEASVDSVDMAEKKLIKL